MKKYQHGSTTVRILAAAILIMWLCPAKAPAITGREIMVMVDEREDGDDRKSVMEMVLINSRDRKRVRKLLSYQKDYGKDTKKLMFFQEPADVEGTAFLSWEHDAIGKEDDKWLYMPALRKVRRISGESTNEYFMGSDFTYDDLGDRNVDEDTHTLIGEEPVNGAACWVIESVPVQPGDYFEKKTVWVRQDAKVVVKAKYHDAQGLIKTYTVKALETIDGIWTIRQMEMDNTRENHRTLMSIDAVKYNTGVPNRFFSVATISRGIVR